MKYNQFGEVISVNGIITGQHLGSPMQDAIAEKPEDNQAYAIARNTQTTLPNSEGTWENQPKSSGGDSEALDSLIDKSIEAITSTVTTIGDYAFYYCMDLMTADFPFAKSIGESAFRYCAWLHDINLPMVESIPNNAFYSCTKLKTINVPMVTSIGSSSFFSCFPLIKIDLPCVTSIGSNAFKSCSELKSFIIRNTKTICTLEYTTAFTSTPIASGTGYIYVPSALIESYKSAKNWSTYAAQFRALEDYTVDGTVTGELDESKI